MGEHRKYKGMTLQQLRQRKALVELKKELALENLHNDVYKLKQTFNFKGKGLTKVTNIADVVVGKGSIYMKYLMFGITAYKGISSLVKLFSKKKKKRINSHG